MPQIRATPSKDRRDQWSCKSVRTKGYRCFSRHHQSSWLLAPRRRPWIIFSRLR